jgi:fibrillarin-like rRNA methylase
MGTNKTRCPTGINTWSITFLTLHKNKKIVNDNAEVFLYMDDTSIIITNLNPTDFTNSAKKILQDINKWFTTNLLSVNADKIQYMNL